MDAAFAGRPDMVEALVEIGADVNVIAGTPGRHSPLVRVTQPHSTIPKHAGHDQVLKLLLASGADPNLPAGPHALCPLAYSAMGGFAGFITDLRDAGAKVGAHLAAMLYDAQALQRGIERDGADAKDDRGRTPLHYLAWSGLWKREEVGSAPALECMEMLLAASADVNAFESIAEGNEVFEATALWRSVGWQGHVLLARRLLEAGADPQSSVFAATFEGTAALCDLLDEYGANWNQRFHGRTALMDLMHWKKPAMSIWLMDHGVDVAVKDDHGRTALHIAATRGVKVDYLEALVAHGADAQAQDDEGKTALDWAREKKRAKAIAYLESI